MDYKREGKKRYLNFVGSVTAPDARSVGIDIVNLDPVVAWASADARRLQSPIGG